MLVVFAAPIIAPPYGMNMVIGFCRNRFFIDFHIGIYYTRIYISGRNIYPFNHYRPTASYAHPTYASYPARPYQGFLFIPRLRRAG